jgi:FtsP/CotA-like multicopper oxidase with cupredoxin domain
MIERGRSAKKFALRRRPAIDLPRRCARYRAGYGRAAVRIAFDADNPGRWALHCHNLDHMQTGMMTEVRYDGIAV